VGLSLGLSRSGKIAALAKPPTRCVADADVVQAVEH
jgi:hypothetical protein